MTGPAQGHDDVRMRGFVSRATVNDTLAWVDRAVADVGNLGSEAINLESAAGRVAAAPVLAPFAVPSFSRSAMDGYALKAEETTGATDYSPLSFRVVGQSWPGAPYTGSLCSGEAVRIMTGAPVPRGATAVMPVEFTHENGDSIQITSAVPEGRHIGGVGEDIPAGSQVLGPGRVLRPQDLGVVASLGIAQVDVLRRPRVRIVTTGNELVPPGQPKGEFQIYDANTTLLVALAERDGGTIESAVRVADTEEAIRQAMCDGRTDVVLVSGGSSVGAEDFAPQVLARAGDLGIHGVAMRPSSPTGMGRIGDRLVFLLPGNPVSCLCAYDFFAGRAVRALGGLNPEWPYATCHAPLIRKISSAIGRVDYCRVRLQGSACEPLAISGASILSSTTRADGFVVVPAECEGFADGTEVLIHLYGCK